MKILRYSILVLALVSVAGCQDNHAKNKAEALERWNSAQTTMRLNMAHQQFKHGATDKALATVQNALRKSPDSVAAHLLVGQIYLEKNSLTLARDSFVQALALDPDLAAAHYFLGGVYERWNDPKQAHGYYLKAWELKSNQVSYLLALVETEVSLGLEETALSRLVDQVQQGQHDASLYMIAGELLTQMGQKDRAVEMYREAHKMEPGSWIVKEALALALHRIGNAKAALPLFQSLVAMETKTQKGAENRAYLMAMGDCYLALGNYLQAKRTFEKMRQLDPLNPVGWTRIAQVELRRKDYKQAKFAAEQALSLQKDDPDAMMALGYVAWKFGKLEKVEFCMNQVLLKTPNNTTAYCLLGQALAKRGQIKDAQGCYRQALKINPEDTLAKRLYQNLQKQKTNAS